MKDQQNPLIGFQIDPVDLQFIGRDLERPECILAERDGTLWSADGRGGVMRIDPDGTQTLILQEGLTANTASGFEDRLVNTRGSLPNGLTFDANGDFLIANFGTDRVERMTRGGKTSVVIDNVDGQPFGKANFVTRDSRGRLWLTVTTTMNPWTDHVKTNSRDGYIALIDERGARIVADNLCGTNELRFDPAEEWLYVAETTSRNITRFRVSGDRLTDREIYGPSNVGGFCDGIAFDAHGNLWTTLIMADRLVAITPEGDLLTILDAGGDKAALAALDRAWEENRVTPELMGACGGTACPWMASLTFGGQDLRRVYLGSLRGSTIPWFDAPVAGLPLIYW
ncbi:SMP-30/gluconolactonase/LRE family protein [Pseudooceanicola sp. CBS1P-1]|uniref:SMP-30/gluconolactonase/LRE family protein n=1 Tax=Pseudooceanicola albus TaxID=2692189 RepID=A0A6L7GB85_9RHOB|nr:MULTISPECIES: SMP-30/gluconolactonase/LRE family protein [Pseudooceanicola]MBT9386800.1 SMP-30/gluconolactonase/LRE family protein [Pseudooceanicola endophyticus]MXN20942.1 SMP-30/gluconolactonase/LRE family protein [Pseudooceanicola albus]